MTFKTQLLLQTLLDFQLNNFLIKFVTYIDGLVKNGKACAKNRILKVTFTLIW